MSDKHAMLQQLGFKDKHKPCSGRHRKNKYSVPNEK